ncbi:hypothetical protein CDL15_Pgr024379 [Punica granatum]|uniref:Uncharacterized protein n=1 Tax=Punica granatum TaxID=22663 RepID=A0A218XYP5_PUNGR|nr:hypothetical protein CDL15_Pgr024379 [Punica granatum]PKI47254.1 hypothetical protein CRG98_032391 [Punica granatum]
MEDDMDSLFEGMVLFTPSQLSDPPLVPQPQPQPIDPSPPPPLDPPAASSSSELLNENLFFDHTLITPLPGYPGTATKSPN